MSKNCSMQKIAQLLLMKTLYQCVMNNEPSNPPLPQGVMRCHYICEGNWDTSLHDSKLLNRPTPANEHVFISISVYLELEQCIQPVVINKDICLSIQVSVYLRVVTCFI